MVNPGSASVRNCAIAIRNASITRRLGSVPGTSGSALKWEGILKASATPCVGLGDLIVDILRMEGRK